MFDIFCTPLASASTNPTDNLGFNFGPCASADATMVVLPPRRQLPAAPKPAQPTGTTRLDIPDDGNLRGNLSGNLAAGL